VLDILLNVVAAAAAGGVAVLRAWMLEGTACESKLAPHTSAISQAAVCLKYLSSAPACLHCGTLPAQQLYKAGREAVHVLTYTHFSLAAIHGLLWMFMLLGARCHLITTSAAHSHT
jgi:hypothetical protein